MKWLLVLVVFKMQDPGMPEIIQIEGFQSEESCKAAGSNLAEILDHETLRMTFPRCLSLG